MVTGNVGSGRNGRQVSACFRNKVMDCRCGHGPAVANVSFISFFFLSFFISIETLKNAQFVQANCMDAAVELSAGFYVYEVPPNCYPGCD